MDEFFGVKKVFSYDRTKRGLAFHCIAATQLKDFNVVANAGKTNNLVIEVNLIDVNVAQLRMMPWDFYYKKQSNIVKATNVPPFEVIETPQTIKLKTSEIQVIVNLDPWALRVETSRADIICQEVFDDYEITEKTLLTYPLGLIAETEKRDTSKKVTSTHESFLLRADEHIYGLGEKFINFDKRGQAITMWNSDALGVRRELSYKNVPFFMSTYGYGLLVDSGKKIKFHIGTKSNRSLEIEVPGDELDCYVIYGPSFKRILNSYTSLTGKPNIPPKWSFGLWVSTYFIPATHKSAVNQARKYREMDIPVDVFHFDPCWLRPGRWCDFTWDKEAFPNPEKTLRQLKQMGFKVCLWINPYVSIHSELYTEGAKQGYFLKRNDGSVYHAATWGEGFPATAIVDFTNQKAKDWCKAQLIRLLKLGVDVFKTDFGEEIPEDAVFSNGKTGKEMRNIYSLLYNKTVFELTKEHTGNQLVWGRCAYAGSQQYPTSWSGDPQCTFEDMASVLRGGLSFAMSGMAFWSHDMGGFWGTPTQSLYIRWSQFGLFSPHSRLHGSSSRDPWLFGEEAVKVLRKYAKLRYRLIPYIYSYAYSANKTGYPVMRPMVLEFQEDPTTIGIDSQYMFGRELLIAPVLNNMGRVCLYLPSGRWMDYWSHKVYQGPKWIKTQVPIDVMPIFVREDSIIPLGPEMSYVGEKKLDPLTVDIYVQKKAEFAFYDDGKVVDFECSRDDSEITLKIGESNRTYIAKFNKINEPVNVEIKGRKISRCRGEDFEKIKEGWYFDDSNQVLRVKIPVKGIEILKVRMKG